MSEITFKLPIDHGTGLSPGFSGMSAPVSSSNAFSKVDSIINTKSNKRPPEVSRFYGFVIMRRGLDLMFANNPFGAYGPQLRSLPAPAKPKKKKKKKKSKRRVA